MGVEFTASANNRDVGMTVDELKAALDMADLYGARYIKKAEITWRGRLQGLTFTDTVHAKWRPGPEVVDGNVLGTAPETRRKSEEEINEEFRDQ